jgi:o-succinylbenzoate synthase
MRIVAARTRDFGGALDRALFSSRHSWSQRDGLLLELEDELGHYGYGEASPLPGYSSDDGASCRAALESLAWPRQLPHGADEGMTTVRRLAAAMPPAARCALETALLDLLGQRLELALWQLLAQAAALPCVPVRLPLAALIHAYEAEEAERESRSLLALGYVSLKLKVGGAQLDQDQNRVARVLDALGERARLRLDANQAWSPALARHALAALGDPRIEYIEEPVAQGRWPEIGSVPVPLAADESLQGLRARISLSALRRSGVGVVVVKPMALGLLAALDLALEARRIGMAVVVSHLLDGPVAWAASSALALALGGGGPAHGLAPHAGLSVWPATRPLAVDGSELTTVAAPGLGLDDTGLLKAEP